MGNNGSARRNLVALGILAIVGFIYYGSYYNYFFHWTDEGAVALTAERLSQGERPYVDVEPLYGILWFYPIAYLFKAFGPDFAVVRVYFLCLAFAAAVLSYALLLRLTRNLPVAFAAALLVLLFHGSIYKTYIPLLVIAGAYALFLYDARTLKSTTPPWIAPVANGAYLAVAFHIRGDIATAYAGLFLLYQALLAVQAALRERNPARLLIFPARIVSVLLVGVLVSAPFAVRAQTDGYLAEFVQEYSRFALELVSKIQARFFLQPDSGVAGAGTLLARPSILSVLGQPRWVFLTYAPLFLLTGIWLFLLWDLFRQRLTPQRLAEFLSARTHLVVLSFGAFSAYPQFFIFRPDMSHLSEFMPGFFVLSAFSLYLLSERSSAPPLLSAVRRSGFWLSGVLCLAYVLTFAQRYEDGLKYRLNRDQRLIVNDRMDVYLSRGEYRFLEQLNTLIRAAAQPNEFVLCFPYCPGVVFMTGRPTFQQALYVDDGFLKSRPDWVQQTRRAIAEKKPRVIVIDNWAVNRTEVSRFQVWAEPLYRFVEETYELRARIVPYEEDKSRWYEVYVLK